MLRGAGTEGDPRVVVSGRLDQRRWEIEDEGCRSEVEIVVGEIEAILRFATVDVH